MGLEKFARPCLSKRSTQAPKPKHIRERKVQLGQAKFRRVLSCCIGMVIIRSSFWHRWELQYHNNGKTGRTEALLFEKFSTETLQLISTTQNFWNAWALSYAHQLRCSFKPVVVTQTTKLGIDQKSIFLVRSYCN